MVLAPAAGDELVLARTDRLPELLQDGAVDGRELHVARRTRVLRDLRRVEPPALTLLPLQRELGSALCASRPRSPREPKQIV